MTPIKSNARINALGVVISDTLLVCYVPDTEHVIEVNQHECILYRHRSPELHRLWCRDTDESAAGAIGDSRTGRGRPMLTFAWLGRARGVGFASEALGDFRTSRRVFSEHSVEIKSPDRGV